MYIHVYTCTVYVNKMSPYSYNNYLSSTVSNYCLTTVVWNWQVHQLLLKLLLNYCSVEMKLLSNYCTVWWYFIHIVILYIINVFPSKLWWPSISGKVHVNISSANEIVVIRYHQTVYYINSVSIQYRLKISVL